MSRRALRIVVSFAAILAIVAASSDSASKIKQNDLPKHTVLDKLDNNGTQSEECRLLDDYDWDEGTILQKFASPGLKALASFGGSILIWDDKTSDHRWLPIMLKSIYYSPDIEGIGSKLDSNLLILQSDCVSLTFRIIRNGDSSGKYIGYISVEAKLGGKIDEICLVVLPKIELEQDSKYAYLSKQAFSCMVDRKKKQGITYMLVIYELELEIDGDPNIIGEQRFSSVAFYRHDDRKIKRDESYKYAFDI